MSTAHQPEAIRLADKYEVNGFLGDHRFAYEFALECMEEAGRNEPTIEDELNGVRRLIDAAIAAQAKQGEKK